MTKKAVMISIDEELHKELKDNEVNVSNICEDALKENVHGSVTDQEESRTCKFCKTTWFGDGIPYKSHQLVWLCPDEVWCCDKCLVGKIRKSKVTVGERF